ncbi:MAG: hypothetical protein ACWGQW_09295 [bacterium]
MNMLKFLKDKEIAEGKQVRSEGAPIPVEESDRSVAESLAVE